MQSLATLVKYLRTIIGVEVVGNPIGPKGQEEFLKALKINKNITPENVRLYSDN